MMNLLKRIMIWAKARGFSFLKPRPKGRGNYKTFKFVTTI